MGSTLRTSHLGQRLRCGRYCLITRNFTRNKDEGDVFTDSPPQLVRLMRKFKILCCQRAIGVSMRIIRDVRPLTPVCTAKVHIIFGLPNIFSHFFVQRQFLPHKCIEYADNYASICIIATAQPADRKSVKSNTHRYGGTRR